MPFAFLVASGLVLLACWISILPLAYVLSRLQPLWEDIETPLSTVQSLTVHVSHVLVTYWWFFLGLLVLATVLWGVGFYRAVCVRGDPPE